MNISLQGYGEQVATFQVNGTVTKGYPVNVTQNYGVTNSTAETAFAGIALEVEGDCVTVQTHGLVTVGYLAGEDAPTLGICPVAANGDGKVKKLTGGRNVLVVALDATAGTVDMVL